MPLRAIKHIALTLSLATALGNEVPLVAAVSVVPVEQAVINQTALAPTLLSGTRNSHGLYHPAPLTFFRVALGIGILSWLAHPHVHPSYEMASAVGLFLANLRMDTDDSLASALASVTSKQAELTPDLYEQWVGGKKIPELFAGEFVGFTVERLRHDGGLPKDALARLTRQVYAGLKKTQDRWSGSLTLERRMAVEWVVPARKDNAAHEIHLEIINSPREETPDFLYMRLGKRNDRPFYIVFLQQRAIQNGRWTRSLEEALIRLQFRALKHSENDTLALLGLGFPLGVVRPSSLNGSETGDIAPYSPSLEGASAPASVLRIHRRLFWTAEDDYFRLDLENASSLLRFIMHDEEIRKRTRKRVLEFPDPAALADKRKLLERVKKLHKDVEEFLRALEILKSPTRNADDVRWLSGFFDCFGSFSPLQREELVNHAFEWLASEANDLALDRDPLTVADRLAIALSCQSIVSAIERRREADRARLRSLNDRFVDLEKGFKLPLLLMELQNNPGHLLSLVEETLASGLWKLSLEYAQLFTVTVLKLTQRPVLREVRGLLSRLRDQNIPLGLLLHDYARPANFGNAGESIRSDLVEAVQEALAIAARNQRLAIVRRPLSAA